MKNFTPLKALLVKLISDNRKEFFLILLLIIGWSTTELGIFYLLKTSIDNFNYENIEKARYIQVVFILGVIALSELFMRISAYIIAKITPAIGALFRDKLTKSLLYKDFEFYHTSSSGEISSQINLASQSAQKLFKTTIFGLLVPICNFIISLVLIYPKFRLMSAFIIWFLILFLFTFMTKASLMRLSEVVEKHNSSYFGRVVDIINNILVVKAAGKEKSEHEQLENENNKLTKFLTSLELHIYFQDLVRSILSFLFFMLLSLFLAKNPNNSYTLGDFVFIISVAIKIRQEIWRASNYIPTLSQDIAFVTAAAENILQVSKPSPSTELKNLENITLRNTTLRYLDNEEIIKNINLKITKGSKVAIVGSSGVGKTSLARLLSGLILPSNGEVLFNNIPSWRVGKFNLYSELIYLPPEPILFERSIMDNIIYFEDKFDAKRYERSLKLSGCGEFISTTQASAKNLAQLSTGQKQRVLIARALYSRKNWLIIDEPSNYLDKNSQDILIDNLLLEYKDKTVIIITHEQSIAAKMEKIIKLNSNGKIDIK